VDKLSMLRLLLVGLGGADEKVDVSELLLPFG